MIKAKKGFINKTSKGLNELIKPISASPNPLKAKKSCKKEKKNASPK